MVNDDIKKDGATVLNRSPIFFQRVWFGFDFYKGYKAL